MGAALPIVGAVMSIGAAFFGRQKEVRTQRAEAAAAEAWRAEAAAQQARTIALQQQTEQAQEQARQAWEHAQRAKAREAQLREELERTGDDARQLQAQYDDFVRENASLKAAKEQLERAYDAVQAEFCAQSDPDKFDKARENIFETFCQKVAEITEHGQKTAKPSVAVLGLGGVGKSSLINALAGEYVTETGVCETTMDISKVFENEHCQLWDVPGSNDERSYTNLVYIMQIKQMHLIFLCYESRVAHITKLEKLIMACKVPYIIIRNKIDITEPSGGKSAAQLNSEAFAKEKVKVQGALCYVSAKTGEGLDQLKRLALQFAGVAL